MHFEEKVEPSANLNDLATETAPLDIADQTLVFAQVVSTGSISEVVLEVSGDGDDWKEWLKNGVSCPIIGGGYMSFENVSAGYARLKVKKVEGSTQTGKLILQAK
jgi:hypothetical protein